MDSLESGTLAPSSQHLLPHPPMMMMMGPPQMYPHSFNPTSSQPAMMNPNPNPNLADVAAMMQNSYLPFGHVNQSQPQLVHNLHEQLPRGPMSQNEPFGYGGSTSQNERFGLAVQPVKRKRGRPRKYPSDNNNNAGTSMLSDTSPAAPINQDNPIVKRGRGRPPGSVKKPKSGSSGVRSHVLFVQEGEDIIAKLRAFSQEVSRTVSVITINGDVCNATVVQSPLSGHTATYNGPLQIFSLSGTFSPPESNASLNHSVSFLCQEGKFLGGKVSGELIAANTIQIILASFIIEAEKSHSPVPFNEVNFVAAPPVADENPASECPSSAAFQEDVNNNSFLNFGSFETEVYDMGRFSNIEWCGENV